MTIVDLFKAKREDDINRIEAASGIRISYEDYSRFLEDGSLFDLLDKVEEVEEAEYYNDHS